MGIYTYKEYSAKINDSHYLAPGSQIIGRCTLGSNVNIWHNAVLRGDVNEIVVGNNTNIQDGSVLHVTERDGLHIAENVTIGHSVNLHGCIIEKNSLIGIGSTILDKAQIGEFSIVAAGSLVPPGKIFPPKSMIMGSPAKVVRDLNDAELIMLTKHYKKYLQYASDFKNPEVVKELKIF